MPIDEIYKAILSVDESKLSEPHIKTLQMCAPERPEVGLSFHINAFCPLRSSSFSPIQIRSILDVI